MSTDSQFLRVRLGATLTAPAGAAAAGRLAHWLMETSGAEAVWLPATGPTVAAPTPSASPRRAASWRAIASAPAWRSTTSTEGR